MTAKNTVIVFSQQPLGQGISEALARKGYDVREIPSDNTASFSEALKAAKASTSVVLAFHNKNWEWALRETAKYNVPVVAYDFGMETGIGIFEPSKVAANNSKAVYYHVGDSIADSSTTKNYLHSRSFNSDTLTTAIEQARENEGKLQLSKRKHLLRLIAEKHEGSHPRGREHYEAPSGRQR